MKPWLWLSPALAHDITPSVLKGFGCFLKTSPIPWRPFEWEGLKFPNRLGIAGGVDKDARNVREWWKLGAGFVEVGTITPKPQPGNPPPVIGRDVGNEALWNRLGFPSQGVERVKSRLQNELARPYLTPVFANIGKNAVTPLEDAHRDYVELFHALHDLVDAFVINISSPNTKGLRELLKSENLKNFLEPIMKARSSRPKPILLKLSPDLDDSQLENALTVSHELGLNGWILTNTSQGLREGLKFPVEGGVSGRPLANSSKEMLQKSLNCLGPRREGKLIVSVGGVMSPEDVQGRLELGADLVQVYAALIFQGPGFLRKVARTQIERER